MGKKKSNHMSKKLKPNQTLDEFQFTSPPPPFITSEAALDIKTFENFITDMINIEINMSKKLKQNQTLEEFQFTSPPPPFITSEAELDIQKIVEFITSMINVEINCENVDKMFDALDILDIAKTCNVMSAVMRYDSFSKIFGILLNFPSDEEKKLYINAKQKIDTLKI